MLDLVVIGGRANGVIVRDMISGEIQRHAAHAVVLATGGYGNAFYLSTNAMGSNVTAAFRAYKRGACFANPCFVQIHPTCIPVHGTFQSKLTLMSESLRNDGRVWVPKDPGDKRKATDIPEADYDVNMFYACLKATGKHVMSGVNDEAGLHRIIDMAAMLAGGEEKLKEKPFISVITSFAISPLKLCTQSTLIMQACNRQGIPVALSAAPMSGSTSPMTMAGTLAQLHAEQLAGIAICQLTNPGAPLLYGGIPGMANMATMGYLGGGVECGMMNAAIHQLAAHIQVPNYNSAGLSDAKLPDAQAGWEKAMTILLGAMGGSNYMHHSAGMLESMLTVAHEQYVIDDEIIGMACKVLKGIEVDAEHLALEVIDTVGPAGNFMMSPHTMTFMRSEYFQGNGVTDSKSRHQWEQGGSLDTRERAKRIARKILEAPEVLYISADIDRSIREKFNILM